MLASTAWASSKTFLSIKDKLTQSKYYSAMKSSPEVLQLVELESKPFGSVCETLISELFQLGPRTSSENDGTRKEQKIEIKTARYWAGEDDCVWQHLEPDHDYDYALLVLLDFQGFKVWIIKKSVLMGEPLRNIEKAKKSKKPVNFQGKQGWWTRKSALLEHLQPIESIADLDAFLRKQNDSSDLEEPAPGPRSVVSADQNLPSLQ